MEFEYIAVESKTGKRTTDLAEAVNVSTLISTLKKQGLKPIKITEVKSAPVRSTSLFSTRHRVNRKELIVFSRQLSSTLNAGLILTDCLETISDDMENVHFAKIINDVIEDLRQGSEFSVALAKYPNVFPTMYVKIVKSGEATGLLNQTIGELAKFLEKSERLLEKVKTAVSYPLFALGFAIFVVLILVLFIIPKFRDMFAQLGADLPLLTQIVLYSGDYFLNNILYFIAAFLLAFCAFIMLMKLHKFRMIIDSIKIGIPLIGKGVIHKALMARFCRSLGFMLSAGLPIATALKLVSEIITHIPMSDSILGIQSHIIGGGTLSDKLRTEKLFTQMAYKMVLVGEKTGKLPQMLNHTADYYDEEIEFMLQKLTTLLEPVLLIFIGGIIMVIVVALFLPVFKISTYI